MNDVLIVETNFKIIGSYGSKKTRFKNLITADSIFGGGSVQANKSYFDYTSRNEAKEELSNDDNYFNYTNRMTYEDTNYTFSSVGFLKNNNDICNFKNNSKPYILKNGSCVYEVIVSFKDLETANKYGFKNYIDYSETTLPFIKSICHIMGFDFKNIIFWQDYHNKKDNGEIHPHIHLNFFEMHKTRPNGKDKIKKNELRRIKNSAIKNFILKKTHKLKHEQNLKLEEIDKIKKQIKIHKPQKEILNDLNKLFKKIPSSGRLSYNSLPMKIFKKDIDKIVFKVLNQPSNKQNLNELKSKMDEYDQLFNNRVNSKISSSYNVELNKIKVKIANKILSLKKDDNLHMQSYVKYFIDKRKAINQNMTVENNKSIDSNSALTNPKLSSEKSKYKKIKPKEFSKTYNDIEEEVSVSCSLRINQIENDINKFLQEMQKEY